MADSIGAIQAKLAAAQQALAKARQDVARLKEELAAAQSAHGHHALASLSVESPHIEVCYMSTVARMVMHARH